MDQDGDLDYAAYIYTYVELFGSDDSTAVVWVENDGNGNFTTEHKLIEFSNVGIRKLTTTDVNNDNLPDIVTRSTSGFLSYFLNIGMGEFSDMVETDITIGSNPIISKDIQNDGMEDLITWDGGQVYWYPNNGDGTYMERVPIGLNNHNFFELADIDKDGDWDVLFASNFDELSWLENDGSGNFEEHFITDLVENNTGYSLAVNDLGTDRIGDIVLGRNGFSQINYLSSACDFSNIITGKVFYDSNQNMVQDIDEYSMSNIGVHILPENLNVYSNSIGSYSFLGDSNITYELSVEDITGWSTTTNSTYIVNLPQDSITSYNFGLYPDSNYKKFDLNISATNTRCSSISLLKINYSNLGSNIEQGIIEFIKHPTSSINNYFPVESDSNASKITWEFNNLAPFNRNSIQIEVEMPGFEELGDELDFAANIIVKDSSGNFLDTFFFHYNPILLCSYDPNDKLLFPIGEEPDNRILNNERLTYTIRFQNTGNAKAFDVTIIDTIDNALDLSTFNLVNSSHNVMYQVNNVSKEVVFEFININLPDSISDPLGSQGFVTFTIFPISNLENSIEVKNKAYIIFDSNPPIITNTITATLVIDFSTAINSTIIEKSKITAYPNPFSDYTIISFEKDNYIQNRQCILFNNQGKKIREYSNVKSNELLIQVEGLAKGIYFLRIINENNSVVEKSLKLIIF